MTKTEIIEFLLKNKKYRETQFSDNFTEFYEEIQNIEFPSDFVFRQKLYHWMYDDYDLSLGLCPVCGKRCEFESLNAGYKHHCSKSCSTLDSKTKDKRKQTCIEKYGVDHESKSMIIKEKKKNTCRKNYGVDWPMQAEVNKEKSKKTNMSRLDVEYPSQSESVMEKYKCTCLERYGVEYPIKSGPFKEKMKNTCLEKYGADSLFGSSEIQKKIKSTCLEKYGVENPVQSDEIKEKIRKTNLERYGVENVFSSDEIKEKIRKTNIEKYGVEHPSQNRHVKEKIRNTNIEKYGVEHPSQNRHVKEKIRKTNIEKYGVACTLNDTLIKEKAIETNIEKYGVPYACMRKEARTHLNDSKPNKEFAKLLEINNIEYKREFAIENYSFDFKIGNTLIEINPTITHNSYINIFGAEPKDKDYHLNKLNCAKEHNYSCIHIWDWDDKDKIINMLKPKEILYARKLELREVPEKECNEFLNLYHLQNTCKGQKIRYGLYKDKTLVQIMTFGKPRYNKNHELELLRLCSHKDYKIVGGVERLFKYILDKFKPESIISYCDNSKFSGGVYKRIGFTLKSKTNPSKHWYNPKSKQHITDNLLRQRGFDQIFKTNYGKGTLNEELMIQYGFLPVYDCGQMTFIYD